MTDQHPHFCAIHIFFNCTSWQNPAGIYCFVQNTIQVVYDHMLNEAKRIIVVSPEGTLLDFESAVINAVRSASPSATVTACYFPLKQTVVKKLTKLV